MDIGGRITLKFIDSIGVKNSFGIFLTFGENNKDWIQSYRKDIFEIFLLSKFSFKQEKSCH